jgi:hypothetical protein
MRLFLFVGLSLLSSQLWSQEPASLGKRLKVIDSIPGPESIAVGPDGAWYVSSFGKFDNGADGAVYRVEPDNGTRERYAGGLEDPCGVVFVGNTLWVADRKGSTGSPAARPSWSTPPGTFPGRCTSSMIWRPTPVESST